MNAGVLMLLLSSHEPFGEYVPAAERPFACMHSMRIQKSLPFTYICFIERVCSNEAAGNAVVHMPGL